MAGRVGGLDEAVECERECGNQGGDAACEGVHTVVSLRFLVVDGENTKAATGRAMPLVAVFG